MALRFEFTCTAITGTVQLVTVSTGGAVAPDGYQVLMEGITTPTEIGANDSALIRQSLAGDKSITLSGVQANCEVEGGATRPVSVIAADTVEVHFTVRCTAFARLTVTTMTTGPSRSFQVRLAGDNYAGSITPAVNNGSITIEVPFAGEYHVSLEGIFVYCLRPPTQTVVIDTTEIALTFAVTCWPRPPSPT